MSGVFFAILVWMIEEAVSQPDRLFVPKNTFDKDPFVLNEDVFFTALSEKTGLPIATCKEIYRILPESFLASTVAQAAVKYMELANQNEEVAFFTLRTLAAGQNPQEKGSSGVMTYSTIALLGKLGFSDVSVKNYEACLGFEGTLLVVEDIMYTGEQLSMALETILKFAPNLKKLVVIVGASSEEALQLVDDPKVAMNALSVIPNFEDIVDTGSAAKLQQFFGEKRSFVVTQHKLPDKHSLNYKARSFLGNRGFARLYKQEAVRNYPEIEFLAEKAHQLFK